MVENKKRPWIHKLFPAFLAAGILFILTPVITYTYFASDLTSKEKIMNRNAEGVILLDRNNKPFFTFYEAKTTQYVPLKKIPEATQKAVISIEDKGFYDHDGFSPRGIIRSFITNLQTKELSQGGSTITQQLVKNALLNPKKNLLRKYQELILAEEIERRYSKEEILEMYLNSVYFGEGAFGIEEAAQTYFGIPAEKLSIAQSAMLAGLLPSPSLLSPISGDPEGARQRQLLVLENMLEEGYITLQEKEQAAKTKLSYTPNPEGLNTNAPHFALMVKKQLEDKFGEEEIARSGLRVRTTIDLNKQEFAEQVVKEQVTKLAGNRVTNGAAVVIDPQTGEILVMVGSKDWYNEQFGKFNVATSPRQPGSAFKPIVYSDALARGIITPGTVLQDKATVFTGGYKPLNYDKRFRGPVTVRRALSNSLNIPAVEIMNKVGIEETLSFAKSMGITSLKDSSNYGLSLVLGTGEISPLQLTNAFATFANEGEFLEATAILEIINKSGRRIYKHTPQAKPALDPRAAFLISSILSDNAARAEVFGNALTISRPAAVKTGTTDQYKDSWTVGYTPSLAVGVWVGNNDGTAMDNIAGSLGAAPIWRQLMEQFLEDKPVEQFIPPDGVTELYVCRGSGLRLLSPSSVGYKEYFLTGTEPTGICYPPRPTTKPEEGKPSSEKPPDQPQPTDNQDSKEKDNGNGNGPKEKE